MNKKVVLKIINYFDSKGKGAEISVSNAKQICELLDIKPIDLQNGIEYLYEVSIPQISFTLLPTRDSKMNVIGCKYNPHIAEEINAVMDKLHISDHSLKNYDEVEFLMNQFIDKVPDFMFYKICEFYYRIKESSLVDIDKVKHVYITEQYITANNISEELLNSILTVGYALKTEDGTIKWKIFNDKEDEDIKEEKPKKTLATTSIEIPDYASLKMNVNNIAVSIKFLADNLLSQIGVEPQKEFNHKALLKELDELFDEYESMQDWEKMKNVNTFINTWKEIRKEYFNDRD